MPKSKRSEYPKSAWNIHDDALLSQKNKKCVSPSNPDLRISAARFAYEMKKRVTLLQPDLRRNATRCMLIIADSAENFKGRYPQIFVLFRQSTFTKGTGYSIAMAVPTGDFFTSSFGTRTVNTPDSYFALISSGFTSPT